MLVSAPDMMMIRFVIVSVLLAIPCLELVRPGLCLEDLQGMGFVLSPPADAASCTVAITSTSEPNHVPHPEDSCDDECYCCCQHVVPQQMFVPPRLFEWVRVLPELVKDLIYLTGDPPDHPPRFRSLVA
jgi:hypothetical protein